MYYPQTEQEEEIIRQYLLETIKNNWGRYPVDLAVNLAQATIDNSEDCYDAIIIPTEELNERLSRKQERTRTEALKSPYFDRAKEYVYLDYWNDLIGGDREEEDGEIIPVLVSISAEELQERIRKPMIESLTDNLWIHDYECQAETLLRLLNLDAAALLNRKENENE